MEGKNGCRVRCTMKGGYRSPEDHWPAIQERQIAAMHRLELAMKPFVTAMKAATGDGGELE